MPTPPRPILDPLRDALYERGTVVSIHTIADACGIDYRRLLAFSQGGPAAFDAGEADRLAAHLGLRLVFVPDDEPVKAGRKTK